MQQGANIPCYYFESHPKNTFPVRVQNYWQTIPFPVSLQFKMFYKRNMLTLTLTQWGLVAGIRRKKKPTWHSLGGDGIRWAGVSSCQHQRWQVITYFHLSMLWSINTPTLFINSLGYFWLYIFIYLDYQWLQDYFLTVLNALNLKIRSVYQMTKFVLESYDREKIEIGNKWTQCRGIKIIDGKIILFKTALLYGGLRQNKWWVGRVWRRLKIVTLLVVFIHIY